MRLLCSSVIVYSFSYAGSVVAVQTTLLHGVSHMSSAHIFPSSAGSGFTGISLLYTVASSSALRPSIILSFS
uniref:Uncharacterized protein n=1 Tax=Oryza brachyantha TaxID=4533 RepID=J3MZR0_ORYBR